MILMSPTEQIDSFDCQATLTSYSAGESNVDNVCDCQPQSNVEDNPRLDCLWQGDTGKLPYEARKLLLRLIKGPYLSGYKDTAQWMQLLVHQQVLKSRLHEIFLELIVDEGNLIAFVKDVDVPDLDNPGATWTQRLTLLQTVMLLVLRKEIISTEVGTKVIVDKDDIWEQIKHFDQNNDEALFKKRFEAAWKNFKSHFNLFEKASPDDEDRVLLSPALRFIFAETQIEELTKSYQKILSEQTNLNPGIETDQIEFAPEQNLHDEEEN